jgi:regulatory protein
VNIFVNENYFGSMYVDVCLKYGIKKGVLISEDKLNEIMLESDKQIALNKTAKYISSKMKTVKEVKDYLVKNEVASEHIIEIINRLDKMHLLNDEQYAYAFLDEVVRKHKGLKYFKYQLTNKGVSSDIINKVSLDYPIDLVIEELIPQVEKLQKKLITYPLNYQKQKLNDKLLRDGFSSNIISQVFSQLNWTCDIKDRLKQEYNKLKKQTNDVTKITQKLLSKGYSYQDIKPYLNDK